MGMFKDLKKLSDQGKAAQEAQGKRTGLIGMMKDMPDQLHQATEAIDDAMAMQADMAKQQQLLTSGTPGTATIKSFTDTGVQVNFNRRSCSMRASRSRARRPTTPRSPRVCRPCTHRSCSPAARSA